MIKTDDSVFLKSVTHWSLLLSIDFWCIAFDNRYAFMKISTYLFRLFPGIRPLLLDCSAVLGVLLAEQRSYKRQGGPRQVENTQGDPILFDQHLNNHNP